MSATDPDKQALRHAVRFFYDLQKLRIQSGLRETSKSAELSEKHHKILGLQSDLLDQLEKNALKSVKEFLRPFPISKWVIAQKGIGPTLAGVLVAEINIENCNTVSQLWAWCGLAVIDGKAQRRKKGEKANYNPWLKAKLLKVMGDCLIKANSPWRKHYDDYKHRKLHTRIDVCMACDGNKTVVFEGKKRQCKNCDGTGGPAPWGKSDAHRHQAAIRVMVKRLLRELWREWRTQEGLETPPDYAEAYLGRVHGDHGGSLISAV